MNWLNAFVILACVAGMFFPRTPRTSPGLLLRGVALVITSWVLLALINLPMIDREQDAIERRIESRDPTLTADEAMNDGVGDRVALLFCGWLPVSVVGGIAIAATLLTRRRRALV